MCAILRVVAYFLSVNLLHMYTVCSSLCVAPTFSFEGIKNFLTGLDLKTTDEENATAE